MNKLRKTALAILVAFMQVFVHAQTTSADNSRQMDLMRSNGKIYVVMVVVVIILTGLIIYLFSLDRKISKLEKKK